MLLAIFHAPNFSYEIKQINYSFMTLKTSRYQNFFSFKATNNIVNDKNPDNIDNNYIYVIIKQV